MKLSDREWKAISITSLFSNLEAGKINNASNLKKTKTGGIEYIAATNRNNGCLYFVEKDEIIYSKIQKGNCIGFIKDGDGSAGYAIYKKEAFVSTVNVIYGYADWLNKYTGLFFVTTQNLIKSKYSHGYKRNYEHLKGDKVMLPVNDKGEPDYIFMEQYVKEMIERKQKQYLDYCREQLKIFGGGYSLIPLADKQWKSFFIGDLFFVKRPTARNKDNYEMGDIPFVASGSVNNGVMKCCKPLENEKLDEADCITVSPVDGNAFYQPYPFLGRGGAGSSILMLYADNLSLYSGQFIAKMIAHTCACKYTYGHMGNKESIKREKIMLPVDENGNPDYNYMEKYSKNLLREKIQNYIGYVVN